MKYRIEKMTLEDLAMGVIEVLRGVPILGYFEEELPLIRESIKDPRAIMLVAKDDSKPQVLGFLIGGISAVRGHINHIATNPRYKEELKGQGIGESLLKSSEAWFLEQGCTRLLLDTAAENRAAAAFFAYQGWKEPPGERHFQKDLK